MLYTFFGMNRFHREYRCLEFFSRYSYHISMKCQWTHPSHTVQIIVPIWQKPVMVYLLYHDMILTGEIILNFFHRLGRPSHFWYSNVNNHKTHTTDNRPSNGIWPKEFWLDNSSTGSASSAISLFIEPRLQLLCPQQHSFPRFDSRSIFYTPQREILSMFLSLYSSDSIPYFFVSTCLFLGIIYLSFTATKILKVLNINGNSFSGCYYWSPPSKWCLEPGPWMAWKCI